MELKRRRDKHRSICFLVLIEPLWNWNSHTWKQVWRNIWVLIEPLWNWNEESSRLTLWCKRVLIEPLWNWNGWGCLREANKWSLNRTFMELKHYLAEKLTLVVCRLNRTFMELKPRNDVLDLLTNMGLNRTFMELKRAIRWDADAGTRRLNRTFMELKPWEGWQQSLKAVVLIEPLWNWNGTDGGSFREWTWS